MAGPLSPVEPMKLPEAGDVAQSQAERYEAFTQPVSPESTVKHQMQGLLSSDSPYLTAARTRAAEQMNQRGLLNTSMALGAGELAATQAALPIAQQDASTYGTAQLEQVKARNEALAQGARLGTDVNLSNQAALNKLLGARTSLASEQQIAQQAAGLEESLRGADYTRALGQASHQAGLEEQIRQSDHERKLETMRYDTTNQKDMMQFDANIRERMMGVEQDSALELESLRQSYEIQKNLDTSLGAMYDGALRSISNVLDNPDMTSAQSKDAIKVITGNLSSGLAFLSGVSAKGAASIAGGAAPTTTTTPAPTQSIATAAPVQFTASENVNQMTIAANKDPVDSGSAIRAGNYPVNVRVPGFGGGSKVVSSEGELMDMIREADVQGGN